MEPVWDQNRRRKGRSVLGAREVGLLGNLGEATEVSPYGGRGTMVVITIIMQ